MGARRVVIALALAALLGACGRAAPREAGIPVAAALAGADDAGFARADRPREFRFPADHGPHPGFRTEWWYVTGNLDAAGRRFGFELTIFRNALAAAAPRRTSEFAAHEVYMAHFALTDVGGRFHSFERFERAALGLAGARAAPFATWVGDWSIAAAPGGTPFPLRVRAAEGDVAVDLVLDEGRAPVLQGEAGLSRKGPGEGNASYYYSMTRLPARGTVRVGDERHSVQGLAWLDREWGTSALGPGVVGWDWFALQLGDGRDLMFYRLRRDDGTSDPLSAGSIVHPGGRVERLAAADVELRPGPTWTSAASGATYPVGWTLRVPRAGLDLRLEAVREDQELRGLVVYWEGAVDVSGSAPGRGYVEMTGYTASPPTSPR